MAWNLPTKSEFSKTVEHYVNARNEDKKRQFNKIVMKGVLLILIGLAGNFWVNVLLYWAGLFIRMTLHFVAATSIAVGFLIISLCPVDQLDFDAAIASNPRARTIVFVSIASFFVYYALKTLPSIQGYGHMIASVFILVIVFGGERVHECGTPRSTSMVVCALFVGTVSAYIPLLVSSVLALKSGKAIDLHSIAGISTVISPVSSLGSFLWVCFFLIAAVIIFIRWSQHQFGHTGDVGRRHPTIGMYEFGYQFVAILTSSMVHLRYGIILCHYEYEYGGILFFISFAFRITIVLMVWTLGRDKMFGFMVRRFDCNRYAYEGAILAELFMVQDFKIGDTFWALDEETDPMLEEGTRVALACSYENWYSGSVSSICTFDAESGLRELTLLMHTNRSYNGPKMYLTAQLPPSKTKEQLLLSAEIRCIDWCEMKADDILSYGSTSTDDIALYERSRPLRKDEKIDYFVSHSWRDDQDAKWIGFSRCAHAFHKRKGRWPTFWIDKFCIPSDERAVDGLKALSIYIRACNSVLVLCGPTFPTRLWCAWEIFTAFAFQSESEALRRIDFVALDVVSEAGGGCASDALKALEMFSVGAAECWDPNDRSKMMKVIDALGRREFDCKVQRMASCIRENMSVPPGIPPASASLYATIPRPLSALALLDLEDGPDQED
eukprot:CAMPEP_0185751096 /NCGR_PEP_ID=MMETSP1174-20130828/9849_1 /TAXON_ID=35687 /ORGANISM="Dictyocha speculum, Strain CCMP1381" /LENGTH=665 /DNA_ID=CAMNT_0028427915 /DNA_START=206 /DNA_END=2203 /DNA_ORIENTATION=+